MDHHKYDDLKDHELKEILDRALNSNPVDVNLLRAVAHLGFINNHYRRRVCMHVAQWGLMLCVVV